jgi:hypothetical protein
MAEEQAPVAEQTAGQAPATEDGQQEEQLDAASLMAELKRVRREAAKYRTDLRQLQAQAEEAQRAQLPEVDRLKADLAAAQRQVAEREAQVAEQQLRSAVLAAAARHGFVDPEDAFRMLDREELALGENGSVDGIEEALGALRKAKPYLVRSAASPALQPTNPAGQRSLTKADVAGMTADEINRRWDEVEKVLAQ